VLSGDIDNIIQGGLRNDFRGITEVKNYSNYKALCRGLAIQSPSLIILDGILIESLADVVKAISESKPLYKVLLILPSDTTKEQMRTLLQYSNVVLDLVIRPFTLKRLYTYLADRFSFSKPQIVTVKQISTDNLSEGMILAEAVFVGGSTEPLFDCGTVLDEACIQALIKNSIKNIKAHKDTSKFMNCWEVKKCGCEAECPAAFFVDADGFLGGINAGRACILLKSTKGPCAGTYKDPAEKVKNLCHGCSFYKMLVKDDIGKITIADLVKYVENKKLPAPPAEPAK
jgi:hypothetical protein